MQFKEFTRGRCFLGKLDYESDIISEIENFASLRDIKTANVHVIGALKKVTIGFYNQEEKEYESMILNEPMEIIQCGGNVTLKDNKPKAHLHIILSDEEGKTIAGHLMEGSVVFAGEMYFEELRGEPLHRGHDEVTGLPLWELED